MLGSRPSGVGFLPAAAAVASSAFDAAGSVLSAKAGADADKAAAKAQIEIARMAAKQAATDARLRGKTTMSWAPIAVGAVALVGIVIAVAVAARSK